MSAAFSNIALPTAALSNAPARPVVNVVTLATKPPPRKRKRAPAPIAATPAPTPTPTPAPVPKETPLPFGWAIALPTGSVVAPYYHHVHTGSVQWERPAVSPECEPRASAVLATPSFASPEEHARACATAMFSTGAVLAPALHSLRSAANLMVPAYRAVHASIGKRGKLLAAQIASNLCTAPPADAELTHCAALAKRIEAAWREDDDDDDHESSDDCQVIESEADARARSRAVTATQLCWAMDDSTPIIWPVAKLERLATFDPMSSQSMLVLSPVHLRRATSVLDEETLCRVSAPDEPDEQPLAAVMPPSMQIFFDDLSDCFFQYDIDLDCNLWPRPGTSAGQEIIRLHEQRAATLRAAGAEVVLQGPRAPRGPLTCSARCLQLPLNQGVRHVWTCPVLRMQGGDPMLHPTSM
jgi:hypothetical protein